ncbi:hypothetical protein L1987_01946 [Smallanthus sonchifolius]|uniref:Uncharacterized protein n=1 Tax=Smallanthus sonchifolius TaxID=185202 RepID=A0ACB9K6H7_9ASTR|nr:hypothetical protein L1987_01946 [Smallanthus sonchifolius]
MRKLGFSRRTGRAYLLSAHRAGPAHLLSAQEEGPAHLLSAQEEGPAHLLSAQEEGPANLLSAQEAWSAHLLSAQAAGSATCQVRRHQNWLSEVMLEVWLRQVMRMNGDAWLEMKSYPTAFEDWHPVMFSYDAEGVVRVVPDDTVGFPPTKFIVKRQEFLRNRKNWKAVEGPAETRKEMKVQVSPYVSSIHRIPHTFGGYPIRFLRGRSDTVPTGTKRYGSYGDEAIRFLRGRSDTVPTGMKRYGSYGNEAIRFLRERSDKVPSGMKHMVP